MKSAYGARLTKAVAERGPLCVGIDPHPALLDRWDLPRSAAGLERMARGMVETLGPQVAVFKPQSAFFEPYGSAGIAVLERTLADIAAAGALSLLDVKRGDMGTSMDAYAAAYLADGSPLAADAITVNPYLGIGSLAGAIDLALQQGRGVYLLALTSNPEGPQFQHARVADGRMVGQVVVEEAGRYNPAGGLGSVGVVVGGTIGRTDVDFSGLSGSILAPGIGAQGATAADLAEVFGLARSLVLPSASREVMAAGPDPAALRAAAARMRGEMEAVLGVG
jgi:orotidine-5'-phosphate decarboxylase